MDEGIIARDHHALERGEEGAIGFGHDPGQLPEQLFQGQFVEFLALDPEAEDGFAPAVLEEMAQHLDILEALQEHFLVIAHENANASTLAPVARAADHSRAVGPAIDQVAQHDHRSIRRSEDHTSQLQSLMRTYYPVF